MADQHVLESLAERLRSTATVESVYGTSMIAAGAAGSGFDLPTQTLPGESLHLSRDEKAALVAFVRALTDTTSQSRWVY
jgi:hypothetical protein